MKLKSLGILSLSATLLFSGIAPIATHAQTPGVEQSDINTSQIINLSQQDMFEITSLSSQDMLEFTTQSNLEWSENLTINGEVEYTISDAEILKFLEISGEDETLAEVTKVMKEDTEMGTYAAGVTKVTINKYGGFTLYLSKTAVTTLAVGGSAAIAFLVSLIPGVGWTLAGVVLGAMMSYLSTTIKHGRIIVFDRGWRVRAVGRQ